MVITNAAAKYKHESVAADKMMYDRTNDGPWQAQPDPRFDAASWGASWVKEYDPHATYIFVRKDLLDSVPVDVYSTNGVDDGQQTDTEIWIGVKDHLLHEVLRHVIQNDNKIQTYITVTLSDFNAPIKIDVPDVAPSDATSPDTKSGSSH